MRYSYQATKNLFLRQSYLDSWEEYSKSLRKSTYIIWDYVVLTASNEEQAEGYRQQIAYRLKRRLLPESTKYIVLPDPEGKRVGSGGATFCVLRHIAELENSRQGERDSDSNELVRPFVGKRILVIHSGGDSKRVPQYSACGKLFAPVLRELPNGQSSTLFDEFIIGMTGVAGRIQEGMLVLSGDVQLLFNPLQIDFQVHGAAAISVKEPVETGKDHGVFLCGEGQEVELFLHKQSEARLRDLGAVNEKGCVDLDTGAILMDVDMLNALYGLICTGREVVETKYNAFVNDRARVSFYGDFLYPLAKGATLDAYYREAAEGCICEELLFCRKKLWEALHGFTLKLLRLSPAEFIHFGTTRELLELMTERIDNYVHLNWRRRVMTNLDVKGHNSVHTSYVAPGTKIGDGSYIENSILEAGVEIGKNSVISNVDLQDVRIPDGVVLHGLQLKDGRYVARIYGVNDNPKGRLEEGATLLGVKLEDFLSGNEVTEAMLWLDDERDLWNARLYPVCGSMEEAVRGALAVYGMAKHPGVREAAAQWRAAERSSLCESFNAADVHAATERKEKLEAIICAARFLEMIRERRPAEDVLGIFGEAGVSKREYALLMEAAEGSELAERMRIYYDLSRHMKSRRVSLCEMSYDALEARSFEALGHAIYENAVRKIPSWKDSRIAKDKVSVRLPVRVNWGGGWTDTPPYCIENGGVVLNAAILLNGKAPVHVEVQRLEERIIRFESADVGVRGSARSLAEIQACNNPYDAFALHKAALVGCGLVPREGGGSLEELLERWGGGVLLSTQVEGVPKGSGLGTSSILAAACVKGLFEFFGREVSDEALCGIVLSMEQLMSTGGGWQDQVGGLIPGIKMITTKPGLDQRMTIDQVKIPDEAMRELRERFVLIYTGQRRLARNLLRDVVGGYIRGREESVEALKKMKRVAALMRFELEQGNIDGFAELLNEHWELSKQLDSGSTNTCIDQIFASCEDMIDGKFIAGAGGGGFLQAILKKNVNREELSRRLQEVFGDNGVDVWNCEIIQ